MFRVFNYLSHQVIAFGSSVMVEFSGVRVFACLFIKDNECRFNFLPAGTVYSYQNSTEEINDFLYLFAKSMSSYDPSAVAPLFVTEYMEAYRYSLQFVCNMIEDMMSSNTRVQNIELLRDLVGYGLDIPTIKEKLEALVNEEVEYRYLMGNAKKIQRGFKRAISDPSYPMCKKRLLREWTQMT